MADATATLVERHPRIKRIHDYWRNLTFGDVLPGRQHLDPCELADLLPHIWILDVARDPMRFRYRLIGTTITELAGADNTGKWLDEVHPECRPGHPTFEAYRSVAETRKIDWRRGRPFFNHSKRYPELERILLPLATDGKNVDMILGLTVFSRRDEQGQLVAAP